MGQNKHDDTNNWIERTVCINKHAKIDRKTNKGIIGESTTQFFLQATSFFGQYVLELLIFAQNFSCLIF